MPRWLLASIGAACRLRRVIPAMVRLTPLFGSVGAIGVAYGADIAIGLPLAAVARLSLRRRPGRVGRRWRWPACSRPPGSPASRKACRRAPLAVVSPLASLASALTVLYAWVILRERPLARRPDRRRAGLRRASSSLAL